MYKIGNSKEATTEQVNEFQKICLTLLKYFPLAVYSAIFCHQFSFLNANREKRSSKE